MRADNGREVETYGERQSFWRLYRANPSDAEHAVAETVVLAYAGDTESVPAVRVSVNKSPFFRHSRLLVAEDVKRLAHPVLRHRLVANFHAEAENVAKDHIVAMILDEVAR